MLPVRLPPGRPRLSTKPSSTGSAAAVKTIGIVDVAAFAANAGAAPPACNYHRHLSFCQFRRQHSELLELIVRPAILNGDVLALRVAKLPQPFSECCDEVGEPFRRGGA